MKCLNLVLVLVLFLVVSLTPTSAFEIANSVNLSNNQTEDLNLSQTNLDGNKQLIDDKVSSIKFYTDSLNSTMNGFSDKMQLIQDDLNFIWDNWWKFWMWWQIGQKTTELFYETPEILSLTNEMSGSIKNLEKECKQLAKECNSHEISPIPYQAETANQNAVEIAKELEHDLKISITVSNVTYLKEGDIVQYTSQGKYYRYLQLIKIRNDSVVVNGSNSINNSIPLDTFKSNSKFKLTTNSSIKSSKIVNQAYTIQQNKLNEQIKKAKSDLEYGNYLYGTGFNIVTIGGGIVWIIVAIAVVIAIIAVNIGILSGFAELYPLMIIFIGIFLLCLIIFVLAKACRDLLWIIGGIMMINGNNTMESANFDLKVLVDELKDLNTFGSSYLNHAPVAQDMNLTSRMGKRINGTLNATDLDEIDTLNYIIDTPPQFGTLNLSDNGSFVYTPFTNFTGNDSFKFKANDCLVDSNIANVNITVNPNRPPNAYNMTLTTKMGRLMNSTFNATDPDNDTLSFKILKKPLHGTLNIISNRFIYTPFANYTGSDTFSYQANDGLNDSNIAQVTIKITRIMNLFENMF